MMDEEEEDMSPPFWLQNSGNNHRRLRRSYSLFLTSGTLVIFLLVIALAFILVIIPTLHSFTSHILKPHLVKKSWDSLNLVLVLFAIFCGFLSRNNNNNEDQTFSDTTNTQQEYTTTTIPDIEIETQTPRSWYYHHEYSDRTLYNRLRSFRSYPDLRQESLAVDNDERWRFYDDTRVNGYRGLHSDSEEEEEEEAKESMKNIEVDTLNFVAQRKQNDNGLEKKNKKASVTKEFFTSLKEKKNNKRKKKKKKKESILNSETPPPPPLPPPSSIFHKSKHKKHNSVSKREDFFAMDENVITEGNESPLIPIPPPPPPPPPFKMPAWKFRVQGDFVRIDSISSEGSGSPDLDETVESPRDDEPAILLVYPNPTPDVDTKADNFIENFRAGLRRTR